MNETKRRKTFTKSNLRLPKVVLTNECSRGEISLSREGIDEWDVRRSIGDIIPNSSLRLGEAETGEESDISNCDRERRTSDF